MQNTCDITLNMNLKKSLRLIYILPDKPLCHNVQLQAKKKNPGKTNMVIECK